MARVFVGLGANIGDRIGSLQQALDELGRLPMTTVLQISSVYETSPVGLPGQPDFLNAIAEISTSLGPEVLLEAIRNIEKKLGRTPSERWGPREIDLDIELYDDRIIESAALTVPHPGMTGRKFVLIPLSELDPMVVHPVSKETVKSIAERCASSERIEKYPATLRISR